MKYTKIFKQIGKDDAGIAGGKGASLGEMISSGISVPDGFVILASTFDKFLKDTDINVEIDAIVSDLKHENMELVESASEKIHDLIMDAEPSEETRKEIISEFEKIDTKYVAVRSSATAEDSSIASWAGELDSYLNTTKDDLIKNVKKCWASLFTPRAIYYRFEKKMHEMKVSVAVVVQKMVQSEVSGITFTVHPVTQDRNQMVIEAGYGLGEAIVGGKITPDTYVIHKDKLDIIDKNISDQKMMIVRSDKGNIEKDVGSNVSEKQKISEDQIKELAKICVNIEKHYKKPQDIEWAVEKGKFYIVQSRPITTLK